MNIRFIGKQSTGTLWLGEKGQKTAPYRSHYKKGSENGVVQKRWTNEEQLGKKKTAGKKGTMGPAQKKGWGGGKKGKSKTGVTFPRDPDKKTGNADFQT